MVTTTEILEGNINHCSGSSKKRAIIYHFIRASLFTSLPSMLYKKISRCNKRFGPGDPGWHLQNTAFSHLQAAHITRAVVTCSHCSISFKLVSLNQEKGVIIIQCGHWCNDIFKMRHFRLNRFHNFTKPQGLGCQWFLWPITEHWRHGPGRNLPGWGLHFSQLSTMSPKAEERTAIPHTHMANLFQCIHWCHNITPRGPFNEERNGGKRGRDRRRKQRRKRRKVGSTELR